MRRSTKVRGEIGTLGDIVRCTYICTCLHKYVCTSPVSIYVHMYIYVGTAIRSLLWYVRMYICTWIRTSVHEVIA